MESATILVIDDQECVRLLLKLVLEGAGFHVAEATNGRHGLELFRERHADLVITDIAMPGASSEELQKAKLLGARQVFQKPFNTQAFLRAVQYELRH